MFVGYIDICPDQHSLAKHKRASLTIFEHRDVLHFALYICSIAREYGEHWLAKSTKSRRVNHFPTVYRVQHRIDPIQALSLDNCSTMITRAILRRKGTHMEAKKRTEVREVDRREKQKSYQYPPLCS
jgi:hypothetical protein